MNFLLKLHVATSCIIGKLTQISVFYHKTIVFWSRLFWSFLAKMFGSMISDFYKVYKPKYSKNQGITTIF